MSLRAWRDEQVALPARGLSRSCVGSSVLCRGDHGLLVHRDARALACFHARAAAISILCRFSRFDPRGILVPSALPQSSFTRFAAHAFRRSRFLPGSRPSSRHHPLASTGRSARVTRTLVFATAPAPALGTPALRLASTPPASFRPQAFAASRRFAPRLGSRACFIPQPCSGPPPFRGLLSRCSSALSSTAPCPLVVDPCALPGFPAATRTNVGFEALFHIEPRCICEAVNLANARSPLRFLAPPGAPSPAGRPVFLGPFRSWR